MKLALFEVTEEEKKEFFQKNLPGHELHFFENPLADNNLPDQTDFDIISVFVGSEVGDKIINAFPNLKHISVRGTGFDKVNVSYAGSKNITVSNVPAYGSHTVAEFTFGLILALTRKIYSGINRLKVGADFSFEGLRGTDLSGKTLGVVGTGKIGVNVIKIAKGFNMNVVAFDSFQNPETAASLNFTYLSLPELLQSADVVTLHIPLTAETKHLINKDNIFTMKKGALVINTARGGIVDTEALFSALLQKHLGGAALDVLEEEGELKEEAELLTQNRLDPAKFKKILEDHLLINLPEVIITPHMAFYSKEAEFSIMETTVKNILAAAEGRPENLVSGESAPPQSPPAAHTLPAALPAADNPPLSHLPPTQPPDQQ